MEKQASTIEQIKGLLDTLSITPRVTKADDVGTVLQIITNPELNSSQKLIMIYMIFDSNESTAQRTLVKGLGLTNKCMRENLNALLEKGYVNRGTRVYTWVLAENYLFYNNGRQKHQQR